MIPSRKDGMARHSARGLLAFYLRSQESPISHLLMSYKKKGFGTHMKSRASSLLEHV